MTTPFTVQQWLSEQALPLICIALALVSILAVLYLSSRYRVHKLAEVRAGRDEDTFVEDMLPFGYDAAIARATYRYLQERQNVAFPIVALDDLDQDLGLDSEDLKQTILDLLEETGRVHLPGLLHTPLVSVEDLVRYIQASPRRVVSGGMRAA